MLFRAALLVALKPHLVYLLWESWHPNKWLEGQNCVNEKQGYQMDMSAMSALWPFATTKPIEKKERMPWRLCGLDLPTERKVNN